MTGTALSGSNADIRAYAMSLPLGMHYVTTTAETVNVPNGYNYCAGYILKRSNTSIMIALFNGSSTAQCVYSTYTWLNWKTTILDTNLGQFKYIAGSIPASGTLQIVNSGNPFAYIVSAQGTFGESYASYIVQGYGGGTTIRNHFTSLQNGEHLAAKIVDNAFVITSTTTATTAVAVIVLMGDPPALK